MVDRKTSRPTRRAPVTIEDRLASLVETFTALANDVRSLNMGLAELNTSLDRQRAALANIKKGVDFLVAKQGTPEPGGMTKAQVDAFQSALDGVTLEAEQLAANTPDGDSPL